MEYKCPGGNNASYFCVNEKCENAAPLCSQETYCEECLERHDKNCVFKSWEELIEDIRQNQYQSQTEVVILSKIDAFLRGIVVTVNSVYQRFHNWKEGRVRKQTEDEIVAKIKSQRRLSGKSINALKNKPVRLYTYFFWLLPFMLFVYSSIDFKRINVSDSYQYVQTCAAPHIIHAFKQKASSDQPTQQKPNIQPKLAELSIDSRIVKDATELQQFFSHQKIKSFRLLYRASQHNFCVKVFHHLCDGIPNAMVVLQNQYGQVMGGYSPLSFQSGLGYENTADLTGQTFLFSLTSRVKFPILHQEKQKAINNDEDWGPTYGRGFDLRISDGADKNKGSYCNFPTSFYNPYEENPEVSKFKFVGTVMQSAFRVAEWEVFEVEFTI